MKTVDLPPYAPTLMESTRAIGYSIEAAIADIIDNSIAASASRVDIDFFPIGESYIAILDNGWGMSSESLIAAMQYGSRNPLEIRDENDLGRYGLGMKTASLSQCRILTVLSKKSGVLTGAQWNLNHIQRAESWSLLLVDEEEAKKYPSFDKLNQYENGTLVVWQDLDKFAVGETDIAEAFAKKMELIREHLSLVFHRYLSGETGLKKLDIRMNEQSVEPQDPFLLKKSTQLMDEEVIVVRGQKVRVKPYILPHTSKLTQKELKSLGGKDGLRKNQGFYVYRNKRLLVWGNWFRLMRQGDLSKLGCRWKQLIKRLNNAVLKNHIITKTTDTAMQRFKAIKQGQNFHSLDDKLKTNTYTDASRTQNTIYLRLDYDEPSGTVVNVRKSMWIHPTLDRAISVREAARLQTFPDSFVFCGSKDKQYQQVGNAVPPIMAKSIAKKLAQTLNKSLLLQEKENG